MENDINNKDLHNRNFGSITLDNNNYNHELSPNINNDSDNKLLIDKLNKDKLLSYDEWIALISSFNKTDQEYATIIARNIATENFGHDVFFRGIIEFTNYCKNDCLYCGIRKSNSCASRYRLTKQEILECCKEGYECGFRTFVLQGGEDDYYSTTVMCDIIRTIHEKYQDCAITLSIGEKSRDEYQAMYDAGANRYLLRHETATKAHYQKLHPGYQSFDNRIRCLNDLKDIGYQTGCGIMVGSPYQTSANLAQDMIYINEFKPQMIGIGPFIPHDKTPFKDMPAGNIDTTLFILSLCRIMLPNVLLPSTTALGTIESDGRSAGILAGCNVIMPNISPMSVREKYMLYNNKAGVDDDTKTGVNKLKEQLNKIGYNMISSRGDYSLRH